jgi:hypothetical protein
MKKLSVVTLVLAVLAVALSAAALWRTRDIPASPSTPTPAAGETTTTTIPLVMVPNVINENVFVASKKMADSKLIFKVVQSPSVGVPRNVVILQIPEAGTSVPEGSEVQLTISNGPP